LLLLEKQGSAEKGSHSYQDAQLNMEMCNGDAKHTKWKMQSKKNCINIKSATSVISNPLPLKKGKTFFFFSTI